MEGWHRRRKLLIHVSRKQREKDRVCAGGLPSSSVLVPSETLTLLCGAVHPREGFLTQHDVSHANDL